MLNTATAIRPRKSAKRAKAITAYMIGSDVRSVDWRWPSGNPEWRMSSKEGTSWDDDGPLNETGRQMLLAHFGLELIARHLPLEKLATMSPKRLLEKRRKLEFQNPKLDKFDPKSNRPGNDISAALAA